METCSVIIRTMNRFYMLKEAVKSVLIQEYPDIEIIIVNDGGPSIKAKIKEEFPNQNIKVVENKETVGRSFAANLGLDHANGKYVGFLDDDDIYYPFHVSELIKFLEEKESKVVYSNALCAEQIKCPFDERVYMTVNLFKEKGDSFSREKLLAGNYIPLNTAIFTKEALGNLRFDENLDVLEDWDFWLNLSKDNDFGYYDQTTCEYRKRLDNTNTTGQLDHIWWWCREYMQEKHKDLLYQEKR